MQSNQKFLCHCISRNPKSFYAFYRYFLFKIKFLKNIIYLKFHSRLVHRLYDQHASEVPVQRDPEHFGAVLPREADSGVALYGVREHQNHALDLRPHVHRFRNCRHRQSRPVHRHPPQTEVILHHLNSAKLCKRATHLSR